MVAEQEDRRRQVLLLLVPTTPHLPVSLLQTTHCVYGNQLTSLILNSPRGESLQGDFPGGPVAKTMLPMQGAWV